MAIVVNHNLQAMNANRMLNINNNALSKSLEKLSSGLKINRAADDASGLSISEKMRAQVRGLDQASANSEDGVSLIQTADGALDTTEQMLQRMRELTVKGNTETLADEDLQAITDEMKTLAQGINQIAERTEFNTKKLLTGAMSNDGKIATIATKTYQTTAATSVKSTAGVTATAGRTVTAGTTIKFATQHSAVNTATVLGGANGAEVARTSGQTITAGTTVATTVTTKNATTATLAKFTSAATLATGTGATCRVITAGTTISTKAATSIKKVADGTTNLSAIITYTNDTKVDIDASKKIHFTAGTSITINNDITAAAAAGDTCVGMTLIDAAGNSIVVAAGSTVAAGTYTIGTGSSYTFSADITANTLTANFAAGSTATLSAGRTISSGTTFSVVSSECKLSADGNLNIKAGDIITYAANQAITAGTTFKTETANIKFDKAVIAKVSANGTLTMTSGSTINAGTDFTYATDYTVSSSATIAGKELTVSAGATVTAGSTVLENGKEMVLQTGANAAQVTKFDIGNMAFSAITTNNSGEDIVKTDTTYGTAGVTYSAGACLVASAITTETVCSQETLVALDVAINAVSTQRSKLGAVQNQLEYTIKNLDNTSENLSSAESRIRDTDMAKEMMNYTKYNILSQASQSMLAQANQQPQSVLSLLQ